jgi:D-glycero-alpha-D-manno-heptose-7-phosphate kinase
LLVVTRTPLRVSLLGGGTDIPAIYRRIGGAVAGLALGEWIDVVVRRRHDLSEPRLVVACGGYQETARVEAIDQALVAETLKFTGLDEPLEIHSLAAIPAGTGLGSSSAFTVGLLHALLAYRNQPVVPLKLAEDAYHIEAERLGRPIGRQDHLFAALGGLRAFTFDPDDRVRTRAIACSAPERLERGILLFRLPGTRSSAEILASLLTVDGSRLDVLKTMAERVSTLVATLEGDCALERIGALLDEGWSLKRSLMPPDAAIDHAYGEARRHGALGGKLLGAGGTGFLLLVAAPEDHGRIRAALTQYPELRFGIDPIGSRVLFRDPTE